MTVWLFSSFDLGVVNGLYIDHCFRVDNNWFGTGHSIFSIAVLNIWVVWQCRVWLSLSIWLKCCQQIVSRSSVPMYTPPLYNGPLPGATLASFLSIKPLQFLEECPYPYPWTEELWHLAHVPLLCKRAVGKMISYLGDEIWCTALPFVSLIIHEKSQ